MCFSKNKQKLTADLHKLQLYFPLNEPKTHWPLAELQITTGAITIYDSLASRKRKKNLPIKVNREWWLSMREKMSSQLPVFLSKSGVLSSKGVASESYEITFQFSESVPYQSSVYGDCGIWVCLLLHRLTNNIPLVFGYPLQVALAFRERMVAYFWKHKVLYISPESDKEDDV